MKYDSFLIFQIQIEFVTISNVDPWDSQGNVIPDLKSILVLRQYFQHLKIILGVRTHFADFVKMNVDKIGLYIEEAHDFVLEIGYSGLNLVFFDLHYL